MTLNEAYNYGVYFLSCNGVDEAEFKSLCLVCHLDGIRNSEYEAHKNDEVIMKRFADLLWRVKSGEPLQYVIGKWDFYESEFYVGKGVLIPRPETEELTELVIKKAKTLDAPVVFDLCAGSGCIGISVAKAVEKADVFCVEKSEDAFFYLEKNARGISNVSLIKADIYEPEKIENIKQADIIVSNPPYIRTDVIENLQKEVKEEPLMALDGGDDGLDFYKAIAEKWYVYIKNNGYLFLEIGEEQGDDVKNILASSGFEEIEVINDLYGNNRMVRAKKA